MRLLLIVNPTASSVTERARAAITDALAVGHELTIADTTRRGHASELARAAVNDSIDVVVVLAGDGTLNEAAHELAGTTTALAPLPGGSTNVFARTLGIAYRPLDACAQLLPSLSARSTRRIGLGLATGDGISRHFVFHLGLGFDAAVVKQMEDRHNHLKRHLAHPAFAVAAVETWLRHYDRDTRISIEAFCASREQPDLVATGPYAVISNSDPYTYVGHRPVTIAPDASLDDALAVTVFRSLRFGLLLRAAASGIARARFVGHSPSIAQGGAVERVEITADRAFPWQVDGDHLGSTERLHVSYEPDVLTIVVP